MHLDSDDEKGEKKSRLSLYIASTLFFFFKNRTPQSTTIYCIQTRNFMRYAKDTTILGRLSQEDKVKVTSKIVHSTLHPKMHPHIDFGIPTFISKGSMLHTGCEDSGLLNGQCDYPLRA